MPGFEQVPFEVVDANFSNREPGAVENLQAARLGRSAASVVGYGDLSYAIAFSKGGTGEADDVREQVALELYVQARLEDRNATAIAEGRAPVELGNIRWLARMTTSDVCLALGEAEKSARGER